MLNDKMRAVAKCISDTMKNVFPKEFLLFVLSGKINEDDIVLQVMFECMKQAYDEKQPRHSIRYFLKKYNLDIDSDKERYKRLRAYVNKYKVREYDYRIKNVDPEDVEAIEYLKGLLPPDMSSMEAKLDGYDVTEMNFYEMSNISELKFFKAFTEKRLMNTKNIDNYTFMEYCKEIDNEIIRLHGRVARSDEETVFSTIAAFTIEWKYAYDFIYNVADAMCKHGIKDIPDEKNRLVMLCGDIISESILGYKFECHSRLATIRKRYIDLIIEEELNSRRFIEEQQKFIEALGVITQLSNKMTIDDIPIRKWFVDNTDMDDWFSICMEYDYFSYVNGFEKDWEKNTNKKIRYMREAFSLVTIPKV